MIGPIYRMTVYAFGESVGGTVLTPRAGSPHTDPFQVASATGVVGYHPYMDPPRGRHGRIDLLTRKTDTGEIVVRILDKRVAGATGNTQRWVTAYWGDDDGWTQLNGCRVLIEESLDMGGSWQIYYTGTIQASGISGRLWADVPIRDNAELGKSEVMAGSPARSVTQGFSSPLMPNALVQDYGPFGGQPLIPGAFESPTGPAGAIRVDASRVAQIDPQSQYTVVTREFWDASRASVGEIFQGSAQVGYNERVTVWVTWTSGALNGQTGRYHMSPFFLDPTLGYRATRPVGMLTTQDGSGHERLAILYVTNVAIDASDPDYLGFGAPGDTCEFYVQAERPSKAAPIYVDYADVRDFLRDLLDGKYGRLLADGTPAEDALPRDESSFTGITREVGGFRAQFSKPLKLNNLIERHIMVPYGLAYYWSEANEFTLVDLDYPSSFVGVPTLTDSDLIAAPSADAHNSLESAIGQIGVVTHHEELQDQAARIVSQPSGYPDVEVTGIQSREREYIPHPFGRLGLTRARYVIDAIGLRSSSRPDGVQGEWNDEIWAQKRAVQIARTFESRYGGGVSTVVVACRRTPTVNALRPGSLVIAGPAEVPNAAGNVRGGDRVYRVLEYRDDGPRRTLVLSDEGPDAVALAPTLGAPTQKTDEQGVTIEQPVTLNGDGDPVRVDVAITATSVGVRPVDGSDLWVQGAYVEATGTVDVSGLPSGSRVWVRGRSERSPNGPPKLPSPWVYPPAPGYVDTVALPAVGALAAVALSGSEIEVTWTVTSDSSIVEVELDGELVEVLPAGSSRYTSRGLEPLTPYTYTLRYRSEVTGGVGPDASVQETTLATSAVAPNMIGIQVLVGDRV